MERLAGGPAGGYQLGEWTWRLLAAARRKAAEIRRHPGIADADCGLGVADGAGRNRDGAVPGIDEMLHQRDRHAAARDRAELGRPRGDLRGHDLQRGNLLARPDRDLPQRLEGGGDTRSLAPLDVGDGVGVRLLPARDHQVEVADLVAFDG